MVKYFKHKEKENVICDVFEGTARFGKWVWQGDTCGEVNTTKAVTEDFYNSFEEITSKEFNEIWGNKLANA